MSQLELSGISKYFGKTRVIEGFNLKVESGSFVVLVGPSGCGKSTILRLIAGLELPTSGQIKIANEDVAGSDPKSRGVAMVFQNYALYPHMTVRQNLSFGLKLAGVSASKISEAVDETAKVLHLEDYLEKKPGQLSGGQKQRVAMGRAMVRQPRIFLFDEPLSNLDASLRVKMRAEIAQLHRRLGCTTIYVTHDQVEAMTLADRIAVMNGGVIEQLATPMELYRAPRTRFVASFIGTPSMNFLPHREVSGIKIADITATVGFRPEHTFLASDSSALSKEFCLSLRHGCVRLIEPIGSVTHLHVELGDNHHVTVETRSTVLPRLGENVSLVVDSRQLFFFDTDGKSIGKSQ